MRKSPILFIFFALLALLVAPALAMPQSMQLRTAPSKVSPVSSGADGHSEKPMQGVKVFIAGQWSPAASMNTPRAFHTATLLSSGKILVTGGANGSTALASAELYDPSGNIWLFAGNMGAARGEHAATLLPSGKVLVTGGSNGGLASAELYEPDTNVWSPVVSMSTPRGRHTATLLPSGKVLVAAGSNPGGYLRGAEASLTQPPARGSRAGA